MKKTLLLTLAFGIFLIGCKKSDLLPNAISNLSETKLSPKLSPPEVTCQLYSIFNPHGPTGASVEYSYIDCAGFLLTGIVDPLQTIMVKAIPGSVKCAGGVVTEIK